MRRLAQLLLFLMFCCAYSAQTNAQTQVAPATEKPAGPVDPVLALTGKPAPALTLKSIDGRPISLSGIYGKQPVYLKVWATYCIQCRIQMPGFKEKFASYRDKMTIIAVNAGVADDVGKVKVFVQEFGLRMPVAMDDGRLGAWMGMKATPVHLVIGRDGRVAFASHQDGPELDAALKQALASKASPAGVATTRLAALVTLKPGDLVPPIELQSSDGKSIALPRGSSARLRAIYFSSTWCESYMAKTQQSEADKCKDGREQVAQLASNPNIEWFGVMSQMWTLPRALAAYDVSMKPGFPLALDASGAAFRTFGVKRIPAVALIDTNGRLVKLVEGDPAKFAAAISSVNASK